MTYFNFERLIKKYSSDFELLSKVDGHYDDMGDYIPGETSKIVLNGAIIGFNESKLYRENGTITTKDKHLYMLTEIENPLMGSEVSYNGNKYKIEIERGKDNSKFTGVYSYVLRWVSSFD